MTPPQIVCPTPDQNYDPASTTGDILVEGATDREDYCASADARIKYNCGLHGVVLAAGHMKDSAGQRFCCNGDAAVTCSAAVQSR